MTDAAMYLCWAPGKTRAPVSADDSWSARKAYSAANGVAIVDVIARRSDLIDDQYLRRTAGSEKLLGQR